MICDAWSWPVHGGGDVYIWEISKILADKHNCKVDIYAPHIVGKIDNINSQPYKNIRVILVGPRNISVDNLFLRAFSGALLAHRVYKEHSMNKYDLINSHGYPSAFTGKMASVLCRIPIVHTVHGSNFLDLNHKIPRYYLEKFLLTMIPFNLEVTVSRNFLKYKNVNRNLVYIPNGVDWQRFSKNMSYKKNKFFTFLWVGRFDRIKGLDILMGAVKKLSLKKKAFIVKLVGDGPVRTEIADLIKSNGLSKQIEILGNKFGKHLVWEYQNADAFVLSSLSEGFPLTVLEAMSASLPVVATRVGEIPNLIKEDVNGFLAEPGDLDSLFAAMHECIKYEERVAMGNRNLNLVKNKYSWMLVTNSVYEAYQRTCSK